jgi:high-affinity K+ transport system ATPase subunit B
MCYYMVIVFTRWHNQCFKWQKLYTHFLPVAEDMLIIQTVKYSFSMLYTLLDFKFLHNMDTSYLFVISVFLYIFVLLSSNMDGRGKARFHGLVNIKDKAKNTCVHTKQRSVSLSQTKNARIRSYSNKNKNKNKQMLQAKHIRCDWIKI